MEEETKTRPSAELQQRAMQSRPSVVFVLVAKPYEDESESKSKKPRNSKKLDCEVGSGFVILDRRPDSIVLTCQHILRHAVSIRVRRVKEGGGVEEYKATVIDSCPTTDVAVLRVLNMSGTPALHLDFRSDFNEPATAIGYCNLPNGLLAGPASARLPSLSPGAIHAYNGFMEANIRDRGNLGKRLLPAVHGATHEVILLSCAIAKGVSGGPIVNTHGVIGFTKGMANDRTLTLAVSSTTILERLRVFANLTANHPATLQQVANRLERRGRQ